MTIASKSNRTQLVQLTTAIIVALLVGSCGASESSAKALTAMSLDGAAGQINEDAKSIAISVPPATNVTAMTATFTTTGASVKVGATDQVSGTTKNDFTSPVIYSVSAADGTTATYTVTVSVASNTAKTFTAFSLFGASGSVTGPGFIDEAAKTIKVSMPAGYDVTALVATFAITGVSVNVGATAQTSGTTPNNFTNPVLYTVTAGDASTQTYSVSVSATANPTAPQLGESGRFVILASQAVTTTGITAISNGDIGIIDIARTGIAGFTPMGSAGDYVELTNGTSFAADDANPAPFPYPLNTSTADPNDTWATTGAMITQVRTDLGIANTFLAADPNPSSATQLCPTELGGLVLTRGVYKTASNVAVSGPLHLDAEGDPTSVFIITVGGTLSISGDIVLDGGALAKNVYWRTATSATIAAGTIFKGWLFAGTRIDVLAGAAITGSLFAVTDRVTLIGDAVTKAP